MRKLTILFVCFLVLGAVGCGKSDNDLQINTEENAPVETVDVADATELLTNVWNSYEEADKFPIGGGDYDNTVMDTPGQYDVSKVEDMDAVLGLPQVASTMIDDVASMMHMMNANTFTAGAYHVMDVSNQQNVMDSLKENIMNRQWMCGFPDTLIIASVGGEYVVSAFGNAEIIEIFKNNLQAKYEITEIVYEEILVE